MAYCVNRVSTYSYTYYKHGFNCNPDIEKILYKPTSHHEYFTGKSYATPLNIDEYQSSKDKILQKGVTYNINDLLGFFVHGIRSNIEILMQILKNRYIKSQIKLDHLYPLKVILDIIIMKQKE